MTNNLPNQPVKLHLGCGQKCLAGYLNIDFPLENHSVQQKSVADLHADITSLNYPQGTVGEVRLHHVFEHFRRPTAAAFLASWNRWLIDGGRLHIEVPDLYRSCLTIVNPLSSFHRKAITERHLFGSHEASWAIHYEAYTADLLSGMMRAFGFKLIKSRHISWRGIYSIELIAVKIRSFNDPADSREAARQYLTNFLVDSSKDELTLLDAWLSMFDEQMHRGLSN